MSQSASPRPGGFPEPGRRIRAVAWTLGLALAIGQAWVGRLAMNADGISYLEVGDAYLRGDWRAAVNAYWSPLYSAALAAAKLVASPFPPLDDFVLAHLLNVLIFAGTFACFDRFLARLVRLRETTTPEEARPTPTRIFLGIAYAAFLFSVFALTRLTLLTPDLALAGFFYLSCSLLLDLRLGHVDGRLWLALGLAVGLGYLAKAPLFVLAPALFTIGALLTPRGQRLRAAATMSLAFALIAGPFVLALSFQKGRLTFGDAGRLNYAWYVNGVQSRHWQGDGGKNGTPSHPTRRLLDAPPVYEFATPIAGTYPFWYDPSYWYEGVKPRPDPAGQVAQFRTNLGFLWRTFFNVHVRSLFRQRELARTESPLLLSALLLGLVLGRRPTAALSSILGYWFLWIPSCLGLALFALVHVETRYIGSFAVVLYLVLWGAVRLPEAPGAHAVTAMACVSVLACVLPAVDIVHSRFVDEPAGEQSLSISREFARSGVGRGRRIASLDYSNRRLAALAHRSGARIVAEIYEDTRSDDEDLFWRADDATRRRVLEAFTKAGATAVISHDAPPDAAGWQPIGATGYSLYPLPEAPNAMAEQNFR